MMVGGLPGALVGGAAGALVTTNHGKAGEAARAVGHSVSDALVAGLVSSSNAIAKTYREKRSYKYGKQKA
jgi:hypothetical protein